MDPVMIFRALGQPQRYALFEDLLQARGVSCCSGIAAEESACCVVDLTARHGLAQSTISHHLQVLAEAGLISVERRGTYRVYQVNTAVWEDFRQHLAGMAVCEGDGRIPMGQAAAE